MADESPRPGASAGDIAVLLQDYVPRSDYEAALEAVQSAMEERDAAKTEAGKHTERLTELEKTVRSRSWRDAYDKLAKDHKVKDEFKDDVYDLLKLSPDADEPDEKAMARSLKAFLEAKKHYVAADADEKPKRIPAGEGSTRGKSTDPGEPEFRVSARERNDASWMRQNGDAFRAAVQGNTLVLDD